MAIPCGGCSSSVDEVRPNGCPVDAVGCYRSQWEIAFDYSSIPHRERMDFFLHAVVGLQLFGRGEMFHTEDAFAPGCNPSGINAVCHYAHVHSQVYLNARV